MKNKDFNITNELRGFMHFSSKILELKNDEEMRNILKAAWWQFRNEQVSRNGQDVLDGWSFVEGMGFSFDPTSTYVGIGLE